MVEGVLRGVVRLVACSLAVLLLAGPAAHADEGMWTLDGLPLELLNEKYGFEPDRSWLERAQLAAVRFNDGGSGSFVGVNGLVLTNHHVAVGQLQKMSSAERDYVATGFYAASPEAEIPSKDLELNVLISMENVTDQILAAVKAEMDEEEKVRARDAERARIEKESMDATGLRSDVISLYRGGEYWLYRYKKYNDVRLVWAPEQQAAYYGGDYDNFTYPRYDLDAALLRVYEDDKPLKVEHYFRINPEGLSEGDLVFVPGHPGGSDRLRTVIQLERQRDFLPMMLSLLDRAKQTLETYASGGPEQARRAQVMIFGLGNAQKAMGGRYEAVSDEQVLADRRAVEKELRARVEAVPALKAEFASAWKKIEKLFAKHGEEMRRRTMRQILTVPFGTRMASWAVQLVLHAEEIEKPDAERLNGYHDSELEELKFYMVAPVPVYRDLDAALMEFTFDMALEELAEGDPLRAIVEGLGDPADAAKKLAEGSRLDDPEVRRGLLEVGRKAVEASDDPLIVWARKVAPLIREQEKWTKANWQSVTVPANEQIARARFAVYGKSAYPDATFSLRLAFGPARGYPMNGTLAPYKTTIYGLYNRALGFDNAGDWELPQRFWDRQDALDMKTPVNFVCECDIIGGNSGSPVINRAGELVGLIFDGNIESLAGNYFFDPERNRAVAVHAAYIIEALRKLYDAGALAEELKENRSM